MKYLITGGAGFIGSNLVERLLSQGHEITVLDNLSTGYKKNISNFLDQIQFFNRSIEEFDFLKIGKLDAVIHLAAQASVPLSVENFEESSSSNILGTIKIISFCKSNKIPLVYASSSAIYGDLDIGNDSENNIDLLTPYSADKYLMEVYTDVAFKNYDMSSIGLRFFNVYGPKQDPKSPYSGVISIFVEKHIQQESITIFGGHQTRDFVYVGDVVNCIIRSIELVMKNKICEIVNVLTGKSISIDDLANKISEISEYQPKKIYATLPAGDPEKSEGTTKKMVDLLKLTISEFIEIEEGLKDIFLHIKKDDN